MLETYTYFLIELNILKDKIMSGKFNKLIKIALHNRAIKEVQKNLFQPIYSSVHG